MPALQIEGPAGALEARHDAPDYALQITAVLCHPHPQYGGSMHDAVLDTTARVLLDHGVNCLRFNFRGVGGSAGQYDNGVGEVDDLMAVANWVVAENPEHSLWLLGYSFGSNIVARSLDTLSPDHAVLIAPPIGMMDFSGATANESLYAIAGSNDDFVDEGKLLEFLGDRAQIIQGADHFFGGFHAELADAVGQAISGKLNPA